MSSKESPYTTYNRKMYFEAQIQFAKNAYEKYLYYRKKLPKKIFDQEPLDPNHFEFYIGKNDVYVIDAHFVLDYRLYELLQADNQNNDVNEALKSYLAYLSVSYNFYKEDIMAAIIELLIEREKQLVRIGKQEYNPAIESSKRLLIDALALNNTYQSSFVYAQNKHHDFGHYPYIEDFLNYVVAYRYNNREKAEMLTPEVLNRLLKEFIEDEGFIIQHKIYLPMDAIKTIANEHKPYVFTRDKKAS
ncbi:MAG: hypothetical protein PHD02_00820 [Bacilli bacterium]|nr:hypothetical protein [Bacilli bacterium]